MVQVVVVGWLAARYKALVGFLKLCEAKGVNFSRCTGRKVEPHNVAPAVNQASVNATIGTPVAHVALCAADE